VWSIAAALPRCGAGFPLSFEVFSVELALPWRFSGRAPPILYETNVTLLMRRQFSHADATLDYSTRSPTVRPWAYA
jgi:hypothetical protein